MPHFDLTLAAPAVVVIKQRQEKNITFLVVRQGLLSLFVILRVLTNVVNEGFHCGYRTAGILTAVHVEWIPCGATMSDDQQSDIEDLGRSVLS